MHFWHKQPRCPAKAGKPAVASKFTGQEIRRAILKKLQSKIRGQHDVAGKDKICGLEAGKSPPSK